MQVVNCELHSNHKEKLHGKHRKLRNIIIKTAMNLKGEKKKKRTERNCKAIQKTINKMIISTYLSIITLNIN